MDKIFKICLNQSPERIDISENIVGIKKLLKTLSKLLFRLEKVFKSLDHFYESIKSILHYSKKQRFLAVT